MALRNIVPRSVFVEASVVPLNALTGEQASEQRVEEQLALFDQRNATWAISCV